MFPGFEDGVGDLEERQEGISQDEVVIGVVAEGKQEQKSSGDDEEGELGLLAERLVALDGVNHETNNHANQAESIDDHNRNEESSGAALEHQSEGVEGVGEEGEH